MDFEFMGGSMGVVVGEKLARLFDIACERRLPVIVFVASGGARMQEGALSLMQMRKYRRRSREFRDARLPYISVLCESDNRWRGRIVCDARRFEYLGAGRADWFCRPRLLR